MAATTSSRFTLGLISDTWARSAARLTVASTPSRRLSLRSTRATQAPHVMPETLISTVKGTCEPMPHRPFSSHREHGFHHRPVHAGYGIVDLLERIHSDDLVDRDSALALPVEQLRDE